MNKNIKGMLVTLWDKPLGRLFLFVLAACVVWVLLSIFLMTLAFAVKYVLLPIVVISVFLYFRYLM